MKKLILLSTFTFIFYFGFSQKSDEIKFPEITTEAKPWTRWWWMGSAVDTPNLKYNIDELGKAGIGGVEITPIYGVKGVEDKYINYLSTKWMDMLAFTEKESNLVGMKVDMNTGTGWPFGGPDVTVEDAATKAIFQTYDIEGGQKIQLTVFVNDEKQIETSYLSRLMAYSEAGDKVDLTSFVMKNTLYWDVPAGNWSVIALFVGKTGQKVKRAAPGGEGYVMDHFSETAVKHYLQKFDRAFSENQVSYPHSFFNDSYEVYGADWTPKFIEEFQKRRGYKLEFYFPELLDKGKTDASRRVVSDYRETIGELLLNNFTVQWTNWAHSHGATTKNQAHGSPANLIDLYAAVDIPECEIFGISDFDIPGLRKDEMSHRNDGDPITLKLASSAAHIAGKKYTSSETFTWLTEHFRTSLSQCKPEIDQVFTSGINHVYFHGTPYSPKETVWPGWLFYASVNMSSTNSIWNDAPAFFAYIARVQSFLQYGEPDNDLLVYFPVYDIWYEQQDNYYFAFGIHGLREKLPRFYETAEKIRKTGREVDFISDKFIQALTIENGLIKTSGGVMYKALVLPEAHFMPVETLSKLYDLAKNGGNIIFADKYPESVPGWKDFAEREKVAQKWIKKFPKTNFTHSKIKKTGKGKIITGTDYEEMLTKANILPESFSKEYQGQYIRRKNESGYHYFFTNLNSNKIDDYISLGVNAKSALIFDPLTNEMGKARLISNKKSGTKIFLQLKPGQSVIVKTFSDQNIALNNWAYYEENLSSVLNLNSGWTLNFAQSEPEVKDTFKLAKLSSWTDLNNSDLKRNMGTGKYSVKFNFNKTAEEYRLSLGDVRESAKVYLNGQFVATLFSVPFEINIGKFLKNGANLLEVEVTNLPANRIANYDRRGVEWRIFNEINFVDINYKKTLYDHWETMPSGLLGPVKIIELTPRHN
ncbi:MAG: glycosyl hydrolase [Paludibacteraceae bacterium]